jgi:hypothetical protein
MSCRLAAISVSFVEMVVQLEMAAPVTTVESFTHLAYNPRLTGIQRAGTKERRSLKTLSLSPD